MMQSIKNIYHFLVSVLANSLYKFPSKNLTVIGVTGTDGKTTTTTLIYNILKSSGKKVSMFSTVGAQIGETTYDTGFHVTTPSPFFLQKHIKKVVESADHFLVLEVTSHALDQYRVNGVKFDVGVVTNITHEHLDYHKTYEKYVRAKAKLLQMSKCAILNKDDESYSLLKKLLPSKKKVLTYGVEESNFINFKNFQFNTKLLGEFNRYNILAAAAVCRELKISDNEIKKAVAEFEAPIGRQEIVHKGEFTVMVDFAHTPNSLTSLLPGIKKLCKGRIIHVFGAASKRDVTKRPLMGEASGRDSDIIILTAEDPRGESVEKINDEIAAGIKGFEKIQVGALPQKGKKYLLSIPDRRDAIEYAIKIARPNDWVVLTGKGHERSMNLGQGEEPWNEQEVVKKALKKR